MLDRDRRLAVAKRGANLITRLGAVSSAGSCPTEACPDKSEHALSALGSRSSWRIPAHVRIPPKGGPGGHAERGLVARAGTSRRATPSAAVRRRPTASRTEPRRSAHIGLVARRRLAAGLGAGSLQRPWRPGGRRRRRPVRQFPPRWRDERSSGQAGCDLDAYRDLVLERGRCGLAPVAGRRYGPGECRSGGSPA